MNCQELLQKIHELTPDCVVSYDSGINEQVLRLYLLFVARCQLSVSKMYSRYDIKPCKYMGRQFYRISHTFKSSNNVPNPRYYPFVNVDAITLDMYCPNGRVPRANLATKDYVCCGYGWQERDSNFILSDRRVKEFDDFVAQHNLN